MDEKTAGRRAAIAEEMWSSEKSYTEAIEQVESVWGKALAECPYKYAQNKRADILGNIGEVLQVE